MYTLDGTRAPVRLWTDPAGVEASALLQARNCANLEWTHGVAVMPDVHHGYGATVGSVIAMRDAVSPGAVGVDIGCGMSAVRTHLTASDLPDSLATVRAQIERDVPVCRGLHQHGPDLRRIGLDTADGRMGIIPGSMGTGSYIVSGKANEDAYRSASHGAGRRMSRGAAKRMFTVEDLQRQTEGMECRKDADVIDEIPGAYKDLETVMAEQRDLVDVEARLRTILCVKG